MASGSRAGSFESESLSTTSYEADAVSSCDESQEAQLERTAGSACANLL